jgi:hypothetical protein
MEHAAWNKMIHIPKFGNSRTKGWSMTSIKSSWRELADQGCNAYLSDGQLTPMLFCYAFPFNVFAIPVPNLESDIGDIVSEHFIRPMINSKEVVATFFACQARLNFPTNKDIDITALDDVIDTPTELSDAVLLVGQIRLREGIETYFKAIKIESAGNLEKHDFDLEPSDSIGGTVTSFLQIIGPPIKDM